MRRFGNHKAAGKYTRLADPRRDEIRRIKGQNKNEPEEKTEGEGRKSKIQEDVGFCDSLAVCIPRCRQ